MDTKSFLTIVRRFGVILFLLAAPSVFQLVWRLSLGPKPIQFLQGYGQLLAYFWWGTSTTYPLIGIWLVSRARLFRSIGGCVRAISYLLAANAGWIAGSLLQAWHHSDREPIYDPTAPLQCLGLASLLSMKVAACVWLFWPLSFLLRRRLTDQVLSSDNVPRPNIRFLLAWTALASVILMSLRILATHGHLLNVAMAGDSMVSAVKGLAIDVPLLIVRFISLAIIMIGFASRPKYWIIAVAAAIIIQYFGQESLFWFVSLFADPRTYYGVLAGAQAERLAFFCGTVFVSIITFWFARVTGLVFVHGTNKVTNSNQS